MTLRMSVASMAVIVALSVVRFEGEGELDGSVVTSTTPMDKEHTDHGRAPAEPPPHHHVPHPYSEKKPHHPSGQRGLPPRPPCRDHHSDHYLWQRG